MPILNQYILIAFEYQNDFKAVRKGYTVPTNLTCRSKDIIVMSLSSHERESKTVLVSGFQTLDSGFQVLDSSLFVRWTWIRIQISNGILDSLSRIPDSTEKRIAGFWIPRTRSPISESKFRLKERNFQSFWQSSLVFVSLTNLRSWLPWWRWPTSHDLLNLYFQ